MGCYFHLPQILRASIARLGDDGLRNSKFADIVQADAACKACISDGDNPRSCQFHGINPNALEMISGGMVLASIARAKVSMVRMLSEAKISRCRFSSSPAAKVLQYETIDHVNGRQDEDNISQPARRFTN